MGRGIWPRASAQEHHYYHVDEVWHAIYNRAERRHMLDPENLDCKDEESKKRRLNLFKNIMVSIFEFDCSCSSGALIFSIRALVATCRFCRNRLRRRLTRSSERKG